MLNYFIYDVGVRLISLTPTFIIEPVFTNYLENQTATRGHSHSMVPTGFGVRSISTRLMPSTSEVIRFTILCRIS